MERENVNPYAPSIAYDDDDDVEIFQIILFETSRAANVYVNRVRVKGCIRIFFFFFLCFMSHVFV